MRVLSLATKACQRQDETAVDYKIILLGMVRSVFAEFRPCFFSECTLSPPTSARQSSSACKTFVYQLFTCEKRQLVLEHEFLQSKTHHVKSENHASSN